MVVSTIFPPDDDRAGALLFYTPTPFCDIDSALTGPASCPLSYGKLEVRGQFDLVCGSTTRIIFGSLVLDATRLARPFFSDSVGPPTWRACCVC